MAIICIAPEIGVGLAVSQWQQAQKALHQSRTSSEELNDIPFSRAHAFFAEMGGILIRSYEMVEDGNSADDIAAPKYIEKAGVNCPRQLEQKLTPGKRLLVASQHVATLGEAYSNPRTGAQTNHGTSSARAPKAPKH